MRLKRQVTQWSIHY